MQSPAPAARLAPAALDPRRWWALALLCGAFFMALTLLLPGRPRKAAHELPEPALATSARD